MMVRSPDKGKATAVFTPATQVEDASGVLPIRAGSNWGWRR